MTLSTDFYVLDDVDPHEVFMFCQRMLGKYDDAGRLPDRQVWADKPQRVFVGPGEWADDPSGRWRVGNQIGQGLPAILDIEYRKGAPLTTAEESRQCTGNCDTDDEEEPYHHHPHPCWLHIDWDTAYSARSGGLNCGQLHAAFIVELGRWLDERGIRWEWRNEYTGEVHGGEERYSALSGLLEGTDEAQAWFWNSVVPAIPAIAERAASGEGARTDEQR